MSLDFATSYAQIIKQEKQDDGTLLVYGKATDDALDIDNQICDAAWLNKAMPEWFKSGGNIREQHSNIAAGVAKELDSKDDGHYISALVVDASSIKKVEAGVLKGFSIGIRAPRIVRDQKAANGRIIDGTIVEVSLVDRPANPNAKLMLAKSNGIEVVQVEEMIEETVEAILEEVTLPEVPDTISEVLATYTTEKVVPEVVQDEVTEEVVEEKADALTVAKSIAGDIVKFDQGLYQAARTALAQLIIVEANEMQAGSDERYSLANLLSAIQCLEAWYEGEAAEGEVADVKEMETVELAATEEKSPTDTLPRIGIEGQDMSENDDDEIDLLNEKTISAIIEKAVKSATETVRNEVELLKSANEADKEIINKLNTELATANQKAVSGGPKRSTITTKGNSINEFYLMAVEYRTKAANTTDPILARGYKDLAAEFEAKALPTN